MRIAIVGYAREGQSSYKYFSKDPNNVITICDADTEVVIPEGCEAKLGPNYLDNLEGFDLIVRTAGQRGKEILSKNPDVKDKITTQLNEFLSVCPSKNMIGVTGTKGKGTTSTLIHKMLEEDGKQAVIVGNIGLPFLDTLDRITPETYVVLELSSFQLSDLKQKSPHIAVCLMVIPEHLNWHKDLDSYISAKSNLFLNQDANDIAIYFSENETSKSIASHSPGKHMAFYSPPGAFIDNDNLVIDNQTICTTTDIKLPGKHNWQNVCAAVTAVWQVTKNTEAIKRVVTSFSGLEHRIEFLKEIEGVKYFNDSYASSLKASEAAIEAIEGKKVIILGGYDRMLELDDFCYYALENEEQFRKVLIIGESGHRLKTCLDNVGFSNYVVATDLKDMNSIVLKAKELARQGDNIVLSPGFASFDMFKNFEDRGNQFKQVVNSL
jgi:UDP-N-acetylmuramoylalanine--D-glutamate ligase